MEITIPLFSEISLKIATAPLTRTHFPSSRLQKGLLLIYAGHELAEEAVGFGVPVIKRGLQTIFAGDVSLASQVDGSIHTVTARYTLNLEEKIARTGAESLEFKLLYDIKNLLAELIRRFQRLRTFLTTISNLLRGLFKWETTFEESEFHTFVNIIYAIDAQAGVVNVAVDTSGLLTEGITEVAIMNEQGAITFDQYRDNRGLQLRGQEIGCWDEVTADQASFLSDDYQIEFSLDQIKGSRLFRGRELIGSRLAWAGFGYSFPPSSQVFNYSIKITKLT